MRLLLFLEHSSNVLAHAWISNCAFPNTKKAGKFDVLHFKLPVQRYVSTAQSNVPAHNEWYQNASNLTI
jgi:hypothetical protein